LEVDAVQQLNEWSTALPGETGVLLGIPHGVSVLGASSRGLKS
jgi:hypothetical protein